MSDIFTDHEARERAAKLMRLLGSDAAGEAEAARAALLRLLARHGATTDDLAQRLFDPLPDGNPALRLTLAAAERRAALAEAASRTARAETARLRAGTTRLRVVAAGLGGVAVLVTGLIGVPALLRRLDPKPVDAVAQNQPQEPAPTLAPGLSPPSLSTVPVGPPAKESSAEPAQPAQAAPPTPPAAGARHGHVIAPEGVLLRLDPVPGTPSVALLSQGTKVIIDQVFPMLGTDWAQVRTAAGAGFVPSSTIGPD